jgi:hypothetical protein
LALRPGQMLAHFVPSSRDVPFQKNARFLFGYPLGDQIAAIANVNRPGFGGGYLLAHQAALLGCSNNWA